MDKLMSIQALAEVIRLAVAPVFLLAAIAGLLGVLSTVSAASSTAPESSNGASRRSRGKMRSN